MTLLDNRVTLSPSFTNDVKQALVEFDEADTIEIPIDYPMHEDSHYWFELKAIDGAQRKYISPVCGLKPKPDSLVAPKANLVHSVVERNGDKVKVIIHRDDFKNELFARAELKVFAIKAVINEGD